MKRLRQILANERGMEVVEWTAIGVLILVIISLLYNAMNGNAQLRAAFTATTDYYAATFGEDVVVFGPRVAPMDFGARRAALLGSTDARLDTWAAQATIVFVPQTTTYVLLSSTRFEQVMIRPAMSVRAEVDPGTTRTRLASMQDNTVAVIDPVNGEAYLIDPVTNVAQPADLSTIQALGLIEVQVDPLAGQVPLAAPVLSVSALLGGN